MESTLENTRSGPSAGHQEAGNQEAGHQQANQEAISILDLLRADTQTDMYFLRSLETQEYSVVVRSFILRQDWEYSMDKLANVANDLLAHGHKVDVRSLRKLFSLVTDDFQLHTRGYFHKEIGWGQYKPTNTAAPEPIFKYREATNSSGTLKSQYKGTLKLNYAGDLNTYIQGIKELVAGQTKLMIVYIAGASGIIAQALNIKDTRIMLNICGESSSGKTTAEHLAMSFWGNDGASVFNTANRTDQLLAERCIMPVTVDDILGNSNYLSDRAKQKSIADQIFRYSTEESKGRFNQESKKIYGAIIASSEVSLFKPLIGSETDGEFYRMIELPIKRGELTKDDQHTRAINRLIHKNYGLGAYELGKYMVEDGYIGDKLLDLYDQQIADLLEDKRLAKYSRTSNRLAILTTTATLLNNCFNLELDLEAIKNTLIESILQTFEVHDEKRDTYTNILKIVKSNPDKFAASNKEYNHTHHIGVYQQNVYGNYELTIPTDRLGPLMRNVSLGQILANTGTQTVRQSPDKETQDILKYWRDRGWLNNCGSKQRLYRKVSLGGASTEGEIKGTQKQILVYTIIFQPDD